MEEKEFKPNWQDVQEVDWDAYMKAIKDSRNKQQIIQHLRHLIEKKGYANMIRAAEVAYNRLVEVLPGGNKTSIGVYSYVDDKEVYCNFRFDPPGGKQDDSFNY
jgi:hypothetical protein